MATTNAYFAAFPWRRKTFTVAVGRFFRDDAPEQPTYEAVLGAVTARRTGLRVGDQFYEGEEMAEYPLTVVGILRPTQSADDRAIFFSLPSFWGMNEVARKMEVKPLTAVLVRPKRMSDLPSLHREFNLAAETQAVFPSVVLLNIFNLLSLAEEVLTMILGIVAIVVLLYLFVSMYSATLERKREIATMRALGARRTTILSIVLLESCAITAIGASSGSWAGMALPTSARTYSPPGADWSRILSSSVLCNPWYSGVSYFWARWQDCSRRCWRIGRRWRTSRHFRRVTGYAQISDYFCYRFL